MTGHLERRSSLHSSQVLRGASPGARASRPQRVEGPGCSKRAGRPRSRGPRTCPAGPRRSFAGYRGTALALALALSSLGGLGSATEAVAASTIEEGRKIALDRKKGNCMACHIIDGATLPGNIGPPLVAMKARFPDKAKLRAQIWDSSQINPRTLMPPFGRHEILTEDEIDKVVEFVHSL